MEHNESIRPSGVTANVSTIGRVVELHLEIPRAPAVAPDGVRTGAAEVDKKKAGKPEASASPAVVVTTTQAPRPAPGAADEEIVSIVLPHGVVWW